MNSWNLTLGEALRTELPHTVYVCSAGDGTVLYVGYTSRHGIERLAEHTDRAWWTAVELIDLARFDTEQAARDHEARQIQTLRPLFNVQGRIPGAPVVFTTNTHLHAALRRAATTILELQADLRALREEHYLTGLVVHVGPQPTQENTP